MAGVEQGNISNEELRNMSASTTAVKISKTKTKRLTAGEKIGEKFIFLVAQAEVLKTVLKLTMTWP